MGQSNGAQSNGAAKVADCLGWRVVAPLIADQPDRRRQANAAGGGAPRVSPPRATAPACLRALVAFPDFLTRNRGSSSGEARG